MEAQAEYAHKRGNASRIMTEQTESAFLRFSKTLDIPQVQLSFIRLAGTCCKDVTRGAGKPINPTALCCFGALMTIN